MLDLCPPEGGAGWVAVSIVQTSHFVTVGAVTVKIVGGAVTVSIDGIDQPVCVRIEELNHHPIFLRQPHTPVAIIGTHRDNFTHSESQEVVHPHNHRLGKRDSFNTVYTKLGTVGKSGGGR